MQPSKPYGLAFGPTHLCSQSIVCSAQPAQLCMADMASLNILLLLIFLIFEIIINFEVFLYYKINHFRSHIFVDPLRYRPLKCAGVSR